ncbi:MAG: tyrosine--tRNA ligase [Saprospiraceae bacterium]
MTFHEELEWRGMLHQMTPGLEELLDGGEPVTAYIGFDPTAPSMTIGNYVQLMLLTLWQRTGNRPIVLMGGATGRIGDPSGKDQERQLKTYEELDHNLKYQAEQARRLLDFEGERPAQLVNNHDFYREMNILEFLRDVGKTLTVSYMMSKDSVQNRLESGLSFTEFSYQLLQAYDFQRLYQDYGVRVQMGGSDQWGNITSGTEFIRRNLGGKAYAVTTPLLTKADGSKFGKSTEGNIWLDAELTSPYDFYQFWLRADDADVPTYLRYFSLRERAEVEADIARVEARVNPNEIKVRLAAELTERIHGAEALRAAQRVTELLYGRSATAEDLAELDAASFRAIAGELENFQLDRAELERGITATDLLATHTTILSSKSEAGRALKGNAISVNKEKVVDADAEFTTAALLHDRYLLLENGKKRKYLLIVN